MKNLFVKKHLIINTKNYNTINCLIQGYFGVYFSSNCLITYNQYKALIFFCKKKLKSYSKLFLRITPKLKNTAKAIGVRMGKGKGSLDEYYFPVYKGQIFFEFGFKKNNFLIKEANDYLKLLKKIRNLIKFSSKKLSINLNFIKNINQYDIDRDRT